jgi:hypothetical protein
MFGTKKLWRKFTATVPHVLIGRWLPQLELDGLELFEPMLAIRKLGKQKFCPYINTDFGEIYIWPCRGGQKAKLPFWDGVSRSSPRSLKKSRNLITFGNGCKK